MLEVGRVFEDQYYIDREIGRGSFGVVYLAHDIVSGEPRAIKVLLPWTRRDQALRHRLQREARLAQMLKSRHAIRIDALRETRDGDFYIVMEYLEGQELTDLLQQGAMPPKRVSEMAAQVLEAVAEAHALGVIHRDLKPNNIFVCDTDEGDLVKVLDFGIAKVAGTQDGSGLFETTKLTVQGGILGTPVYMSPEQCRGEALTTASDIYSLGVVLYEALAGHVPFDDANPVRVLMMHNQSAAPPLDPKVAGSHLGRAVMRALAKAPADRFQSAAEFADAIRGRWPERLAASVKPIEAASIATPLEAADSPAAESSDAAAPREPQKLAATRRGTSILSKPSFWMAICLALAAVLVVLGVALQSL